MARCYVSREKYENYRPTDAGASEVNQQQALLSCTTSLGPGI